jgi:hypothetical protein
MEAVLEWAELYKLYILYRCEKNKTAFFWG